MAYDKPGQKLAGRLLDHDWPLDAPSPRLCDGASRFSADAFLQMRSA